MVQQGSFIFFSSTLESKREYLSLQQVRNILLEIARNNKLLSYFPDLKRTAYLSLQYGTDFQKLVKEYTEIKHTYFYACRV